jgi:hypothetical protein
MIGFDFARTFNPPSRLGTATGIVNVGGFVARTAQYDLTDFKVALAMQYLVGLFGLGGILRTRRLARRKMAEQGVVVRPIRQVLAERRSLAPHRPVKAEGSEPLSTVHQRRT